MSWMANWSLTAIALPGNRIELTVPRKDSIPGEVNFINDVRGRSWLYSLKQVNGRHYLMAASLKPRIPLALLLKDELFKPLVRAGVLAMLAAIALAILLGNWVEAPLTEVGQSVRCSIPR